jgi:hypothetical protein
MHDMPTQSVLEGVAHRGLLVLVGIVADLEGSHPRDVGNIEDPVIITSDAPW